MQILYNYKILDLFINKFFISKLLQNLLILSILSNNKQLDTKVFFFLKKLNLLRLAA